MARAPVGKKTLRGGSKVPWVLLLLVVAAAVGLGFYGLERYRLLVDNDQAKADELAKARSELAQVDKRLRSTKAELGRAEVDVRTNRERFTQNAAEAEEIAQRLADIVGTDRSDVRVGENDLTLQVADTALFRLGTAELSPDGKVILDKLGELLTEMREKNIWVEGHTSDEPVKEVAKGFDTNWEFTAARSVAVVRYLIGEAGIDPERLAVMAYGEYRPISRNSKAKNRRIDIVLVPKALRRVED